MPVGKVAQLITRHGRRLHRESAIARDAEPAVVGRPRLLIVAYHFPPSTVVGARRPGALAGLAAERGWDVRVLTATATGGGMPVQGISDEQIIRAPSMFGGRWMSRFRSAATPDTSTVPAPGRMTSGLGGLRGSCRRVVGSLKGLAREALFLPDPQAGWIAPAVKRFRGAGQDWRPDVVVASGPPFSVFVVAAWLARTLDTSWIADYRDLWTVGNEYWGFGRSRVRKAADHWLERRLLRSVARCVTVSEPLAETLRSTFHVQADVVMNGIDRRRAPADPQPAVGVADLRDRDLAEVSPRVLTLAHTGALYPGRRTPDPLLNAMKLLGDDRARVRLVLAGADHLVAQEAVRRSGTADCVRVVGELPVADSWTIQSQADVLVLLMWNDPRDAGTVPGKLFDYLLARRPILMIGHPEGVAAHLLRSRAAGVVLSDPRDIAEQLRAWLSVKDHTGQVPGPADTALEGLFREEQMDSYFRILTTTIGRRDLTTGRPRGAADVRRPTRGGDGPSRG
jgi:glycosyltransferase involved in cell wall biosynthesis